MELKNMKQHKGFTILELMIVLGIIGIISAFAIPAYNNYTRRANRTAARDALTTVAQKMQSLYSLNKSYSCGVQMNNPPACNSTPSAELVKWLGGDTYAKSGNRNLYQISITSNDTSYQILATAVDDQLKDEGCKVFYINQSGQRWAENVGGNVFAPQAAGSKKCWDRR